MSNIPKLKKLLDFVAELADHQGNEWFKDELLFRLLHHNSGSESFAAGFSELQENVELIRKYLTLDVIPIIDYSGIENEAVRNQLFRDSIEMAKFRLGKINGLISFDEFCRYAQLQAEELVNYFLNTRFHKDIGKTIEFITAYSNYKVTTRMPETLNHIDYAYKLKSFAAFSFLENRIKSCLEYVNNIRNELSHRNSLQKLQDDELLIEFERLGFSGNKFHDLTKLSIEEKKVFFSGRYIHFKRRQDYQEIYESLDTLKLKVIGELIKD